MIVGGRKPWRRILLYGPPGTGRSSVASGIKEQETNDRMGKENGKKIMGSNKKEK